MKRHIEVVHEGIMPFSCDFCGLGMWNKPQLLKHVKKIHENGNLEENKWRCEFCNCKILSEDELDKHILSVHDGKVE